MTISEFFERIEKAEKKYTNVLNEENNVNEGSPKSGI